MKRLSHEHGLAGTILVGVVAWALGAVLMLTGTLVSAQQIDHRVEVITHEVSPIDGDLDSVALAAETNRVANEILVAAKPLSGQLDQVLATRIKENVESIDANAGKINAAVDSIDSRANAINGEVLSINGSVRAINGTAKKINTTVRSIDGSVNGINGTVKTIEGSLGGLLPVVRQIRGEHEGVDGFGAGLAGINRRAETIIALVQGIKSDTGNVLKLVGSIDATAKSINSKVSGPLFP